MVAAIWPHQPAKLSATTRNTDRRTPRSAHVTRQNARVQHTLRSSRSSLKEWGWSSLNLAIINTDVSGTAIVIEFPDEAAYDAWHKRLDEITGDGEEPFGFRGEWGTTPRLITPEQALTLIPDSRRNRPGLPPLRDHSSAPVSRVRAKRLRQSCPRP